jgi:cell division protein FtsW
MRFDPTIIISVLALAILGTVMVYSASAVKADRDFAGDGYYFFKRQLVFLAAGVLVMLACAAIPYRFWGVAAMPLVPVTLILLLLVLSPLGHTANNASRWFKIGPFSLQIAEFSKLVVAIYLARYLAGRGEEVSEDSRLLIKPLVIVAAMVALVAMEPDLGTAMYIGLMCLTMLFIGGVPVRVLGGLGLAAVPFVSYMIMAREFRVQRIKAFLDPWKEYEGSGFQLVQSFLAFGEGGLFGAGLGAGKSKLLFLPESHTDFILSVVGEELGFVGVSIVLALFAAIAVRGMKAAWAAPDQFGTLLAAGMTALVVLQALINAMVVLGLVPTKGLPLPFISYGGSSLLVSMAAMGVLLNVAARGREA